MYPAPLFVVRTALDVVGSTRKKSLNKLNLKECPGVLDLFGNKTGFFSPFRILIIGACSCGFIKTNQINLNF